MIKQTLVLLATLAALPAAWGDFKAGDRLPDLSIADRGELVLEGDDFDYRSWNYPQQPGKVHVLQYMAATSSASELNDPFIDRLKTDFPTGTLLSTTVLNLDEALWGTGGFVTSQLESNKKQFPHAVLVADEKGVGLNTWKLEEDSAAIIVTDSQGAVLYFKQGAMSPAEVNSTIELIKQQLPGKAS
jgi:YtfJ family uncharacterized protein